MYLSKDTTERQEPRGHPAVTPGESRDGLVAALVTAADQKIDAAAAAGTVIAAGNDLEAEGPSAVATLVDRTGTAHR